MDTSRIEHVADAIDMWLMDGGISDEDFFEAVELLKTRRMVRKALRGGA
jgi:hypothetical protein